MTDIDGKTLSPLPSQNLIVLTHIMYALHTVAIIMSMGALAFVVFMFLTGLPSIVAIILNYVTRSSVRNTFLDSHFSWQGRTFWWTLLLVGISSLIIYGLTATGYYLFPQFGLGVGFVGVGTWVVFYLGLALWVIYRVFRGWITLVCRKPLPM
jgi:uncharacterized membrane protein